MWAQTPAPGATPAGPVSYVLSGKILEKGGAHVPALGGSLYLEAVANTPTASQAASFSLSADADLKGYYKALVPAGTYHLVVAAEGYGKVDLPSLEIAKDTQKDFFLERTGFTMPEVVVSTEKSPKTEVSHEVLTQQELTSVPGSMGGDVIRALQSLPGVVNAGIADGQLLVRGSGPSDNLYLVDRVPIAFPYHIDGVISVLDSNLVKDIDFSTGGFGPEFPGVMGGLVDVDQRDGRGDHWGFRTDVNLFLAEAQAEGPVAPNMTLALAGRESYLQVFGKAFDTESSSLPTFGDYQVKLSYNPSHEVHWDVLALGSTDAYSASIPATETAQDPVYTGVFSYSQGFNSQGVNFRDIAPDGNGFYNTLYHYNFYFNEDLGSNLYNNTTTEDFGDWFAFTRDFDADTQLTAGVKYDHLVNGIQAYDVSFPTAGQGQTFSLTTAPKVAANATTPTDIAGAYLDQKFKFFDQKLQFSLGGRLDYFGNSSQLDASPRLSAAYLLSNDTTLKGSYGFYYEPPTQVEDGYFLEPGLGNPGLGPEESICSILGVEQKLEPGLTLRVEGFNKQFSQLFVSTGTGENYDNSGTGYARGVEFFLKKDPTDRFFGWISCTLSDSQRQDTPGAPSYVYDFDEPSNFMVVGSYKLNPGWDLGIKWTYATGLPYTPVVGTVYDSTDNFYIPISGALNSARVPDYERLDVSTSFKTVYDTWEWKIYLDVFNFLGNQNVLGYTYNADYTQKYPFKDLPFLPFLGFEAEF